jgi:hypothetical protein
MAIVTKVNPETPILCHSCGWHGRIKDCNCEIDCLVVCPKCGEKVSKTLSEDGSFIFPTCLIENLLRLDVQPEYIIKTEDEK